MHLGMSDVSLPPDHQKGQVERPSVLTFEFEEREDQHVMIHRIEPLETDAFFESLRERIAGTPNESALVYIHGFNVPFR